jgi:3D-(3,5/4)-trihydroxycyclohexane-1,2-dione acylhydrolase (decyclizing)
VIDRLQTFKGVPSFNNLLKDVRHKRLVTVDFAKHAEAMGAIAEHVRSLGDLEAAIDRARKADRTSVITISTDAHTWTPGDAWWDVGVPEVSTSEKVRAARSDHMTQKHKQRAGV